MKSFKFILSIISLMTFYNITYSMSATIGYVEIRLNGELKPLIYHIKKELAEPNSVFANTLIYRYDASSKEYIKISVQDLIEHYSDDIKNNNFIHIPCNKYVKIGAILIGTTDRSISKCFRKNFLFGYAIMKLYNDEL